MKLSLKTIRPVGNPVILTKAKLDYTHFGGFNIEFYQSGTAALATAILAIINTKHPKTSNPEVILPAYACPDLISAIVFAGATPIIADLEFETCWLSLKQIENHITDKTIAIIAVRFLGISERLEQLLNLCKKFNLTLIEDSAQGFPLTRPDTYWKGDVVILSFGRGKPVNMLGGGAVLTKNKPINNKLIPISAGTNSFSNMAKYLLKAIAYNSLISSEVYGAALKLPGLNIGETVYKPLEGIQGIPLPIKERIKPNIEFYKKNKNVGNSIHQRVKSLGAIGLSDLPTTCQHDFLDPLLRYPLLVENSEARDILYKELFKYGASIMYKKPLYYIDKMPAILNHNNFHYDNAEDFAGRLITLATHKDVSENILDKVFEKINSILA